MAANDQQLQALIGINQQLNKSEETTRRLGSLNDRLGSSLVSILRSTSKYSTAIEEIVELEAKGVSSIKEQLKLKQKVKDIEATINVLRSKEEVYKRSLTIIQTKELEKLKFKVDAQKVIAHQEERINKILAAGNLSTAQKLQLDRISRGIYQTKIDAETEIQKIAKDNAEVLQPFLIERQKESLELLSKQLQLESSRLSKFQVFKEVIKEYFKESFKGTGGLVKAAAAILGLTLTIKGLVSLTKEAFFAVDSAATNITKSSGLSRDISGQLVKNYRAIQQNSKGFNESLNESVYTNRNLLAAQQELQASTEALSLYTEKSVKSQVYLTKQLGLSAEEASKLSNLSVITQQSTDSITNAVFDQTAALIKSNGIRLQGKAILRDLAKIEGVIAANYNNNPKKLIEAVTLAKSLGTSLQEAARASRSLLDFESSIENELEAELLTGRRFNLEKARSLALDGDSAAAIKEMLKNVGSLNDFQKQNVLAKEAEAKAVGMTVDELANALRQQELLKNLNREDLAARDEILEKIKGTAEFDKYRAQINAATNAQQLKAAEESIDKQTKFNNLVDKLKDVIAQIGEGPLVKLFTGFERAIEVAEKYTWVLKGAAALLAAMAVSATIASFGANLVAAGLATTAVVGGAALVGGGLAAGGSLIALNDGVVDPNGGIVLSTPKGQIKTNKDDYIVATTDPASLLGGGGSGKTDQLLAAILSAVSKPSGVYIDSYRAGTALGISNSAFA